MATIKKSTTNKCIIQEDEQLAEVIHQYPCLYDKSDAGYKEKDRKINAWRAVEEALGYEEGINILIYNLLFIIFT